MFALPGYAQKAVLERKRPSLVNKKYIYLKKKDHQPIILPAMKYKRMNTSLLSYKLELKHGEKTKTDLIIVPPGDHILY